MYAVLEGFKFFKGSWESRGVPGIPEVSGDPWGSQESRVPGDREAPGLGPTFLPCPSACCN